MSETCSGLTIANTLIRTNSACQHCLLICSQRAHCSSTLPAYFSSCERACHDIFRVLQFKAPVSRLTPSSRDHLSVDTNRLNYVMKHTPYCQKLHRSALQRFRPRAFPKNKAINSYLDRLNQRDEASSWATQASRNFCFPTFLNDEDASAVQANSGTYSYALVNTLVPARDIPA
jgi:hypothetical protein